MFSEVGLAVYGLLRISKKPKEAKSLCQLTYNRPIQAYGTEGSVVRLNSAFRKVSKKFAVDFDELASEVDHRQSAGEAREHALIDLLRKNLPSRVGVEQGGFVVDAHGNESAEMDVVIYDKSLGTVFNAIEGEKYFPCETVIAVGEVKTNVDSNATLTDALDKVRSVKMLDRSNEGKNNAIVGPGIAKKGSSSTPTPTTGIRYSASYLRVHRCRGTR